MKARITDRKVLESLRPFEVSAYLRSTGWTLAGFMGDSATVWNQGERRVWLPQDIAFADYARRLAEILETLAETESRSELEIVRDLATATADVVRVRVASALASDGSVSIEEGVRLFECSKDMLLSAARAAVAPRAYFRSRLPGPAEGYMRKVRLGQTEVGSYVVTLVCPVSPELQPAQSELLQNVEEPFDRRVTRTLAGALNKTAMAARDAGLRQDMEPFTAAVREGVSSNLCNALAEIGGGMEEGHIEVGFTWARSRKAPEGTISRVVIPYDAVPVMREAARVLREIYADNDFELAGPVVRLESADSAAGGEVLVYAEVDTWRRVKVYLGAHDYQLAVMAHKTGLEVSCRGRLEKEGRYFTLKDVRGFGLNEPIP
jgi:hypothetical protein